MDIIFIKHITNNINISSFCIVFNKNDTLFNITSKI